VYKIFRKEEWATLVERSAFTGSADDARDGFIHLSTEEQLAGTLAKHYRGTASVVIARVRTAGLAIRMEESRDNLLFPHLYGTLRHEDVVSFEERKLK
jgi:uncharacterized protein (DUF952 family)